MRVGHEWLQGVLSHPRSGSTLGVSRYSRSTVYERVRYPYILTEHGELPFTFGVRAPKFSSFLATALAKTRSPSKDELPHVVLTKKKKKKGPSPHSFHLVGPSKPAIPTLFPPTSQLSLAWGELTGCMHFPVKPRPPWCSRSFGFDFTLRR